MPYLSAKKYVKLSATVGTTNVNLAHGLGTVPDLVLLTVTGTVAGVVRQVSKDATNIVLVSTLASTTIEALVFE
jgi:hypothetical protein